MGGATPTPIAYWMRPPPCDRQDKLLTATPVNERRATGLALAAVALWSTVATAFKLGLAHLEPSQLLLIGSSISLALFGVLRSTRGNLRALLVRPWRDHRRCMLLGLLNPCAYYLVLFEAYDRLPAQIAQPLNYTWAITLALLSVPLLGQRLGPRALAGIALGYAGAALLVGRGGLSLAPGVDPLGVALALGSTLIWAVYWLQNARADRADALDTMTLSFFWGSLGVLAVCLASDGLPDLSAAGLLYGAWVGMVEMGLTFLLWQAALAHTASAARIGQLIFLSPLASFVLIALVLGEPLHASAVVALLLILAGVVIAQRA